MTYENLDAADGAASEPSLKAFTIWVLASQGVGLLAVILTAAWMANHDGGFSWEPDHVFNFHPLFMVIGMVFLYADGILVYRIFRSVRKMRVKIIHASLHILALIFAIVGLRAVFNSHNLKVPPTPNLYSLHSWLGITVVVLFCMQWLAGFTAFLLPNLKLPEKWKKLYLPVHQHWGVIVFVMATVTAITGITEKNAFHADASQLPGWEKLSNSLGFVLGIFCLLVVYIVRRTEYRRTDAAQVAAVAAGKDDLDLQQQADHSERLEG